MKCLLPGLIAVFTLTLTTTSSASPISPDRCQSLFHLSDYDNAIPVCRKAARAGNAESAWLMGQMMSQGLGGQKNESEALKWFRIAARENHADSLYNLAVMLDMGQGTEENNSEAVKWYSKAAEQGHVHSQHNLALMYAHGEGVKQDFEKALKWTRQAANNGLAESQYLLGQIYSTGDELVTPSSEETIKWFTRAGNQDHVKSQLSLALTYAKGLGTKIDPHQAMDWARRAAFLGDVQAQYLLGILRLRYSEDDLDLQAAAAWLTVAESSAFTAATEPLRRVTEKLSNKDIQEAKQSAQAIIETILRQQYSFNNFSSK